MSGYSADPSRSFEGEEDAGLSLDELSRAYSELVGDGDDPYQPAAEAPNPDGSAELWEEVAAEAEADADDACPISPRSILEAMLFVGHQDNQPLTSRQVAGLMRGVRPREIEELVKELNQQYLAAGAPYHIASVGPGHQLQLRDEYSRLRDRFHGRTKAARLSQPALDVLAIVAYQPGATREQVDKLRGAKSAPLLRQLVRRHLLSMQRPAKQPRAPKYFTTERFLELVRIVDLKDLPQSEGSEYRISEQPPQE